MNGCLDNILEKKIPHSTNDRMLVLWLKCSWSNSRFVRQSIKPCIFSDWFGIKGSYFFFKNAVDLPSITIRSSYLAKWTNMIFSVEASQKNHWRKKDRRWKICYLMVTYKTSFLKIDLRCFNEVLLIVCYFLGIFQ